MGGWGSGRQNGKPLAEEAKRIDVSWMLRKGLLRPGARGSGSLSWNRGGEPVGNIGFTFDMIDPDAAHMTLQFTVTRWGEAEGRRQSQHVRLSYTVPTYGGQRWWMHCPHTGRRVAKLYMPAGALTFACRRAYGIAHRSQRQTAEDRPFEALFRLQRRLGCKEGWEQFIHRPKGMWQRTYDRINRRYWQLDAQCNAVMAGKLATLKGQIARLERK